MARVGDYGLRAGDVLLVRGNGNIKLVGRAAEVTEDRLDSIYPDLLIRVRPRREVDPRFLVISINSLAARHQLEIASRTAVGTFKINGETVKNLRLALPDTAEQIAISEDCNVRAQRINSSIDASIREVDLLREFRTRLTSDVVTGQVDVREIAATLPELTDGGPAAVDDPFDDD